MYKNNFDIQIFFVGANGLEPLTYAGYEIYSFAPFPAVRYSQIKFAGDIGIEPILYKLTACCLMPISQPPFIFS